MYTAFIFFGGLSDVFLSLMLWFILDEDKPQQFVLDGDRVYTVTDVIKEGRYSANSINNATNTTKMSSMRNTFRLATTDSL